MFSLLKCMKCPSGALYLSREGPIMLRCEFGNYQFSPVPVTKMRKCPMVMYERGKIPPKGPKPVALRTGEVRPGRSPV